MEISPITGIRALSVMKPQRVDFGLSPVFDMEHLSKIGDETYSPSGGKSAGGHEDEFDDPEGDEAESTESAAGNDVGRPISFFA